MRAAGGGEMVFKKGFGERGGVKMVFEEGLGEEIDGDSAYLLVAAGCRNHEPWIQRLLVSGLL